MGLTLSLAALFAARQLATWPVRLRYPGEEDIEGMQLAQMLHLRQGIPIYAQPSLQRLESPIYGPLSYLLGASLINPAEPAFLPLRVLSMLATLGCAAACAVLAFWATRSYLAALLAPLLFLSYGLVTQYGTIARTDIVGLFVTLLGFLVAYRYRRGRGLLLSVPVLLLALFYKQQFVAAPLAIAAYLLWEKRYRLAAEFGSLFAAGGLALLALFQFVVFHGQAFLMHYVFYNLVPYSSFFWIRGWLFFGVTFTVPLLVALGFVRKHPDRLLTCYLVCAVLLSVGVVPKAGSSTNYFLESQAIFSTLFAAQIVVGSRRTAGAAKWLGILVAALLLQSIWPTGHVPRPDDFKRDQAIQEFLRSNFAPDTPALSFWVGDLVRADLDTPFPNIYHFKELVQNGILKEKTLTDQIERHRFGLVLLDFDLRTHQNDRMANLYLTPGVRASILANYRVAAVLDLPGPEKNPINEAAYFWVPRSEPAERRAEKSHSLR